MTNENEMEKAISVEIAARSPFTAQEVYSAWQSCKSFDMVLAAVEYCATFGLASLSIAISCLVPSTQEPKCLCPADGIYPGCPIHGKHR